MARVTSSIHRTFCTDAIHAGQAPDPATGAISPAIHPAVNYAQDEPGIASAGFVYSRTDNPTRSSLETCLAALDQAYHARVFATGMAAADASIRATCRPGDHIVISAGAFSGTFRLLHRVLSDWSIEHTAVDCSRPGSVSSALRPNTRLVWVESPSNPMLDIADIQIVAEITNKSGAKLVVDNTLASPYLQQPLHLGADIVVYSNKYVSGHSDSMAGIVVTNDGEIAERIAFLQNAAGAVPSPWDCWLTLRGAKTLAVRLERQCDNAERVVEALQQHPQVTRLLYPGMPEHPGHRIAASQMRRFGGVVSFTVDGGQDTARKVCSSTKLFTLAESLGGVESLIQLPNLMTHRPAIHPMPELPPDLIRLSLGLEEADDLIADLYQALC